MLHTGVPQKMSFSVFLALTEVFWGIRTATAQFTFNFNGGRRTTFCCKITRFKKKLSRFKTPKKRLWGLKKTLKDIFCGTPCMYIIKIYFTKLTYKGKYLIFDTNYKSFLAIALCKFCRIFFFSIDNPFQEPHGSFFKTRNLLENPYFPFLFSFCKFQLSTF